MTSENFVDDDTGQDYRQALEEGYLPIREVARSTGINAVTLRAWERRYGPVSYTHLDVYKRQGLQQGCPLPGSATESAASLPEP